MSLRIIINDKEWSNPIVKYGLAMAVFIGSIAIAALIVFVLLPVIGVSIAATMGLMIVMSVGVLAAAIALVLGSAILSVLIVLIDYIVDKFKGRS